MDKNQFKLLMIFKLLISFNLISCQENSNFTCQNKFDGECSGTKLRFDTEYSLKSFNLFGKVRKVTQTNYEKNNYSKSVQIFNQNGKITSNTNFKNKNIVSNKVVRNYNNYNQIIEELYYSSDTTQIESKRIFEFSRNIQNSYLLNNKNKKIGELNVEFNSKGYKTKSTLKSFLENYLLDETTYYEYDSNGRLIKQKGNNNSETNYLFDNSGNTIGFFDEKNDTLLYDFTYDKFNNEIGKYDHLQYDKENNWIKKYQIINGEKHLISERLIEYY